MDKQPDFGQLFRLSDPVAKQPFRARLDISTELALAWLRDEGVGGSIDAKWHSGSTRPSDVVWTGLAIPVIVSQRVLQVLEDCGATGWTYSPCNLHGKSGEEITNYFFLRIRGRCGPIDEKRSLLVRTYPAGDYVDLKGLYFEPNSWDGSSVFMPEGRNALKFVTMEVKDALERAGIGNLRLTPLDQVEWPFQKRSGDEFVPKSAIH